MTKQVYIDCSPLLLHSDSIIKYVDSERSDGKTTFLLKTAYESNCETGKLPVFARRTVGEITTLMLNTAADNLKVVIPEFKRDVVTFKGSPKKDGITLYEGAEPRILFVPLSRTSAIKSALDWKTHRNLYIDEYVPLNGRYLSNEAAIILELYQTIDRKHYDNYIFVASNKLTATNPLFKYFNIIPQKGFTTYKHNRFALLRWHNKGNARRAEQSAFGELVEGTDYESYNTGGVLVERMHLIEPQHTKNQMPFIINCNGNLYACYTAKTTPQNPANIPQVYIIDRYKNDPHYAKYAVYTVTPNCGKYGGIYIAYSSATFKYLRSLHFCSMLLFASQTILEELQPLLQLFTR